jgi:CRISPR system Cascade subunit CasA
MRRLDVSDISKYKNYFVQLSMGTFDTTFLPYEHDPKLLKAVVAGRRTLTRNLAKIGENN